MSWFCTMFRCWGKWARCTKDLFVFFLKTQVNLLATTRFFSRLWAPTPPLALSTLGPSQMVCADSICHGITDSAGKEVHWVREQKTKGFQSLYYWVPIFTSRKVKSNNNNSTSLCVTNSPLNGFFKSGQHGPNQCATFPLHLLCLDIWEKTKAAIAQEWLWKWCTAWNERPPPQIAPCTEEGLDFNRPNASDSNARPDTSEISNLGQVLWVIPTATSRHFGSWKSPLCHWGSDNNHQDQLWLNC